MSYTFAHGCVLGRVTSLVRFSFVFLAHVLWTGVKGGYFCTAMAYDEAWVSGYISTNVVVIQFSCEM